MSRTLDIDQLIDPDDEARQISSRYLEWASYRRKWIEEKKELRNYVFATDTRTTSNQVLPWANSTTTPKLTQIYDNLKANYTLALFPNEDWFDWMAKDQEAASVAKRSAIMSYMKSKIKLSDFVQDAEKLIDDYLLTGNCFATVTYENNVKEVDGEIFQNYVGPKLVRISPHDIVFDPTAASFKETPKIIRSIKTLGDIAKMAADDPEIARVFEKMKQNRRSVGDASQTDKSEGFIADGFTSIENYYKSSFVEILTFYGDTYNHQTGELKTNRKVIIFDRSYVVSDIENPIWLGGDGVYHAGWRGRPDNLYAMGPLDNLVGMQYRIDHLENLKADVFDQIAYPVVKIRGDVEDFNIEPGTKIWVGDEGDVGYLTPDATALNADFQIKALETKMEEMAGAPQLAMGIRSPGEKTAFEVQTLDNAANRIFNHKAGQFEIQFMQPILSSMLETARRNMNAADTVGNLNPNTGVVVFKTITKDDITANGALYPKGARHFQEKARRVQSLSQLIQLKATDPSVSAHLSGKLLARILAEELGEADLFKENIAITEQQAVQEAMENSEADHLEGLMIKQEQGL